MSMDTVVAFLRNGMCCVNDLNLLSTTVLYDPSYISLFYTLPEPLDQTTPLEFLIGLAQLYAVVSMCSGGIRMIADGAVKLRTVKRVKRIHEGQHRQASHSTAHRVVEQCLDEEYGRALRSMFVGVNVFMIGLCFVWLVANSFHLTGTNVIGGVQGLIHALTAAEVGLLALLYYMLSDGASKLRDSLRIRQLKDTLVRSKGRLANVTDKDFVDAQTYGWLVHGGWNFLDSINETDNDEKALSLQITTVQTTVDALFAEEKKGANNSDGQDEESKTLSYAVELASKRLDRQASVVRMQGYLEYLYFLYNLVAFYGYMIAVLCFYLEDGEGEPTYWTKMKFGMSNAEADWTGNFSGDLMWTLEPFTALVAPYAMRMMSPSTKVKED